MNTETFRVDYLCTQFIVLAVALLAWILFVSFEVGPMAFVVGLAPVALAAPIAWYMSVVQIDSQGLTLYRVNRVRWEEITKAKKLSILGLPYLCLWRRSGLPWFVPLYVFKSHVLISRFEAWCPSDSPIASALSYLPKSK